MNDLLGEYFKRDLTEEEDRQLAKQLSSSLEDSQRMIQWMDELYQSTGLPSPVWPDIPPLFLKKSKWRFVQPLSLLTLVGLMIGFWVYDGDLRIKPVLSPIVKRVFQTPSLIVSPSEPVLKKQKPQASRIGKTTSLPLNPATPPVAQTSFLEISPALSVDPSVPRQPTTLLNVITSTPESPSFSPLTRKKSRKLLVVVRFQKAGWVTVQVLDRQNTGVRKLYAGDLPVGSRSFIWDGKTEKEEEVPPGAYFIEVRSGQDVIRHEIHVESTRRIEPF